MPRRRTPTRRSRTKLDQLGAELDAIDDRPHSYDPVQKAIAGVFVTLGANGQLQIEAGFVRPEDEPRAEDWRRSMNSEDGDAPHRSSDDGIADGVVRQWQVRQTAHRTVRRR